MRNKRIDCTYVTHLVLTKDQAISLSKNLHITSLFAEKLNLFIRIYQEHFVS